MMKSMMILAALIGLLVTPFAASQADYTIWQSPLAGVTTSDHLSIGLSLPGTGLRITTDAAGLEYEWLTVGLTMPSDVTIEGVVVCYELADQSSYISQVRLTRMTTPDHATVIHDDPTDLTDPGPTCYLSEVFGEPVEGTISLALRLYFSSTDHWIDVGAIGLIVSPIVSDVNDDPVIDDLGGMSLRPNQPNPFGPETMIEYTLESADQVELQILDVSGRAVRTLFRGEQSMGEYRVMWDGRDDRGAQMAAGTYFYRVRIGEEEGSRGMVMVN